MRAHLGFCAWVLPDNRKGRDHNLNVLTEGHQFACHQNVEPHDHRGYHPWEKNFKFLIEFLRNLVDVVLTGPKPARSRRGRRRRLTYESIFHHLLHMVQQFDVEVTCEETLLTISDTKKSMRTA